MRQTNPQNQSTKLHVENIGGIEETSVRFSSGVTGLIGENATNRTSLVRAIAAGLGSDQYTLKSDSDTGKVSLTVAGETHTRTLQRENGTVEAAGDPYLDSPDYADLYAVLLRSNAIRRAVRESGDLRSLILEPVDTEEINRKISARVDERREIDEELDRLDKLTAKLSDCRSKREETNGQIERLDTQIEEKRHALDGMEDEAQPPDVGITETLDEKLAELSDTRSQLERVTANVESERKSLESLRESQSTIEKQYESMSMPDAEKVAALEERIDRLRDQKQELDSTVSELQRVIRFNDRNLNGSQSSIHQALGSETSDSVTDQLDPSNSTVTCWTCGSQVKRSSIDEMLDRLRQFETEKTEEKKQIRSQIEEVRRELDDIRSRREELSELESKIESFDRKIERKESNIEEFEQRQETLEERVDSLETEIEALEMSRHDDFLEVQEEVSRLTFEKEQVETRLEELDSEIERIESELEARERLNERRDELSVELEELRTRIDRIEREAIDEFNSHTAAIVDELGYENIDRIWMERTEVEIEHGRGDDAKTQFKLHLVREDDANKMYEDTIDHLSESEREIVGLVVALAGYIVHDIHEKVPFMLLDSVEMIDGERLAGLVSYLEQYVPYLIVVLLPDHARAFEENPPSQEYDPVRI